MRTLFAPCNFAVFDGQNTDTHFAKTGGFRSYGIRLFYTCYAAGSTITLLPPLVIVQRPFG
mgnify:CR=1